MKKCLYAILIFILVGCSPQASEQDKQREKVESQRNKTKDAHVSPFHKLRVIECDNHEFIVLVNTEWSDVEASFIHHPTCKFCKGTEN